MSNLNDWFSKHVWGRAAPKALIAAGSLGFAGLLQVGVWLYLANNEAIFREQSTGTSLVVSRAGDISSSNSQKLTVTTYMDSPVGERSYDRTVDLNGTGKYDQGTGTYRPYMVGEQLSGRVIANKPDSMRLDNDNAYQSRFFMFSSLFFLAVSALFWAVVLVAASRRRKALGR